MMYTLVGAILALGWLGIYQKTEEQNSDYYLIFAGLVLLLFMGLRGSFTADYSSYTKLFSRYSKYTLNQIALLDKEPLFALFIKGVSRFSVHSQVHHFAMATMVCVPALIAIKRSSKNYLLSIFFFFALTYYIASFNATRNSIAISILLIGYPFLIKKKILHWIICVIIAAGFHLSAVLFIPLIALFFIPANRRRVVLLVIFVVFAVTKYDKILLFFQQELGFYSNYTSNSYGMWSQVFADISKKRLLVRSSIYIAYFAMFVMKKELIDEKSYIGVLSLGAYLTQFQLVIFARYDLYFMAFFIFLFPNTFEEFGFPKLIKTALTTTIIVLCLIWVFTSYGGEYYPFWHNIKVIK